MSDNAECPCEGRTILLERLRVLTGAQDFWSIERIVDDLIFRMKGLEK